MTSLAKYRAYWRERASKEESRKEKLRAEALKIAERLKDILVKEFSVKKVMLYGSALQRGCFDQDSDIDLAVEGLPKDAYFGALARVIMESEFEVDLKPFEDVRDLLRQEIARGRVLYEKRENS